jgi:hypothetical protein
MLKQIALTGSVVTLALLSACGSPTPPRLSLSERLPIAVDFVRQPNGASRSRAENIRDEAACEIRATEARRNAAMLVIAGVSRAPLLALDGPTDAIDQAYDNTYLTCERSHGWERVATQAEADQIVAKARADRLAGR